VDYKQGTLVQIIGEPKYFSERGFPLITQDIIDSNNEPQSMLTVENYDKWYTMHIIHSDGRVQSIYNNILDALNDLTWIDHAVVPYMFHKIADDLGLVYDNRTFAMVCERFVEDVLNNDWARLAQYLPKEN
jgi:hypothetical protein